MDGHVVMSQKWRTESIKRPALQSLSLSQCRFAIYSCIIARGRTRVRLHKCVCADVGVRLPVCVCKRVRGCFLWVCVCLWSWLYML